MAAEDVDKSEQSIMDRMLGKEEQPTDSDDTDLETPATATVDAEDESADEEDVDEETETEEEEPEEAEIPEKIQDILKKNRKATREAEARAKELERKVYELEHPGEEVPAEPQADTKFKTLFVTSAAKSALTEAGFTTGIERFVKMIDFDDLEVAEDGTIDGLTEQVDQLKKEFEDVIAPKKPVVRKTVKTDAAKGKESTPTPKTDEQILTDRLFGR